MYVLCDLPRLSGYLILVDLCLGRGALFFVIYPALVDIRSRLTSVSAEVPFFSAIYPDLADI